MNWSRAIAQGRQAVPFVGEAASPGSIVHQGDDVFHHAASLLRRCRTVRRCPQHGRPRLTGRPAMAYLRGGEGGENKKGSVVCRPGTAPTP